MGQADERCPGKARTPAPQARAALPPGLCPDSFTHHYSFIRQACAEGLFRLDLGRHTLMKTLVTGPTTLPSSYVVRAMPGRGLLVRSGSAPEASRSESFLRLVNPWNRGRRQPLSGGFCHESEPGSGRGQRTREGLIHPWPAMMRPENGAKMHRLV